MNKAKLITTVLSGGSGYPTPAQYGNQTGHWDASKWATSLYTDAAGTTLATAQDQLIYRLGDLSGNGRNMDRYSIDGYRGQLKLNVQNGLAGVLNQTATDMAYQSTFMSNFFTSTEKVAFCVVKNFTVDTDNGTTYNNDSILTSSNAFWGVTVRSSGPVYQYNYGGGQTPSGITLANNVAAVITAWHTGGNLYLQKNNGAPASIATTATTNMTGLLGIFGTYSAYHSRGYILEVSVHNAYNAAAHQNTILGLMQKWGIS